MNVSICNTFNNRSRIVKLYLVDWNSVAAAHSEYLNSDRTHTNIEGQNAFVDAAKSVFSES